MNFEFDEALSKTFRTVKGVAAEVTGMSDNKDIATNTANAAYGKDTQHNGKADAMRHILFSALATQDYTDVGAKTISFLNENITWNQPKAEKNMDTTNDAIGREIGRKAKSKEEMVQMAKDAIDSGRAVVIGKELQGPYY
jgi:hypothetical protein